MARAKKLIEANLFRFSVGWRNPPKEFVTRCYQYLGKVNTLEGRASLADDYLKQAEKFFRDGHMVVDLASLLLFQADLHRRCKHWDEAWRCTEEALNLAMPRGLALIHADALILRGRIRLDHRNATQDIAPKKAEAIALQVVDDARDGLSLAERCGYAWAERDAQALLADAHDVLGRADEARRHRQEAELLTEDLQL